ncbi:hypothetical protein C7475_10113 [Chitinophaga sp. S165]|nr:hypothetical protein C7475_10113 [Chitinophaga sp. S165]
MKKATNLTNNVFYEIGGALSVVCFSFMQIVVILCPKT